jgi:RNA polymerase sigma factor (sigma-70 family)
MQEVVPMDHDTDMGGPSAVFPATRYTVILASSSPNPQTRRQALEALITVYWKPIYKYIRLKGRKDNEDAKDLTQAFFTRALEKGFFQRYDPAKARFRTYLRICVDGFLSNERKSAGCGKRGGDRKFFALDFESAEGELCGQRISQPIDPDALFHREWVRSVFSLAVEELRRQCTASNRSVHFALFQRYDLEGPDCAHKPTYAQLAAEFDLTVSQVTNYLAGARQGFRKLVLDSIRATTGSDEEFRVEAQRLLGGDLS